MRLRSDSFERKKEATRNAEIRVATKETRGNKFGISHEYENSILFPLLEQISLTRARFLNYRFDRM